ncbi:MAG: hypothetical protein ACPLRN_00915 [Microgenomates group bacterium]
MDIKKIILELVLFFYLFSNYSLIFALATTTPPPTPTPTYTLFQDNNRNNFDIGRILSGKEELLNFGKNCGNIGQACCGKLVSPDLTAISNNILGFLSGTGISPILKVVSFLPSLVITFVQPASDYIINFFGNLGFAKETRGYCVQGYPSNIYDINQCTCVSSVNLQASRLCSALKNTAEINQCFNNCMKDGGGVWTALGCFSSDFSTLIKEKVFGFGIGLAGTIAFLCIIYAAFQIQTSSGNAEKIKKAQELLTSCIMGLILIIFSVFILRLIGVNILKIPGFN